MIVNCFLDKLANKERSNRLVVANGAADLKNAIARIIGSVEDVGLDQLCSEFGATLAKTWNSSPAKVEEAIRTLYASVQALNV